MIFDKDLDKSLWYILEADEENRKLIIEFLKRLPEDVLLYLQSSLVKAKENVSKDFYFEDDFIAEDGTSYSYIIEKSFEEMSLEIVHTIGQSTNSQHPSMIFSEELNLWHEFLDDENPVVGNFTYKVETTEPCPSLACYDFVPSFDLSGSCGSKKELEFEYTLTKNGSNYSVKRDFIRHRTDFYNIDVSQIPSELTMEYIEGRYLDSSKIKKYSAK